MAFRLDINGGSTPLPDTEYETIKAALNGSLEFVRIPGGTDAAAGMYVDDEGRLKKLPTNQAASALAGQEILGSVVVMTRAEVEEDMAG